MLKVFVSLKTTGANPLVHEISNFAAVFLKNDEIVERFSMPIHTEDKGILPMSSDRMSDVVSETPTKKKYEAQDVIAYFEKITKFYSGNKLPEVICHGASRIEGFLKNWMAQISKRPDQIFITPITDISQIIKTHYGDVSADIADLDFWTVSEIEGIESSAYEADFIELDVIVEVYLRLIRKKSHEFEKSSNRLEATKDDLILPKNFSAN